MIIVYDTLTGQGRKFASRIGPPFHDIKAVKPADDEQIFLITRSINFGQITETTQSFLDSYSKQVVGLAVSGNRNWGANFGKAGDKIQEKYGIPLVVKFEASGFPEDIETVKQYLEEVRK